LNQGRAADSAEEVTLHTAHPYAVRPRTKASGRLLLAVPLVVVDLDLSSPDPGILADGVRKYLPGALNRRASLGRLKIPCLPAAK